MKIGSYGIALITLLSVFLFPAQASAYVGPGAGLTVIGTVVALVGGIILAIVGFIWYPIKRLLGIKKKKKKPEKSITNDEIVNTGKVDSHLEESLDQRQ